MILLFGASGQLGTELSTAAERGGVALNGLGHKEANIADPETVRRALLDTQPDIVVNAAAFTDVDLAERESEAAERTNAIGPAVLADACAEAGVPLVHISTDYVFGGGPGGRAFIEADAIAPLGVYGATKARGEAAIRERLPRHLILRTAWLYSAHHRNFLTTILRLAAEREEIAVVDDQYGSPTAASDLANAILRVAPMLPGKFMAWGTYHFAGLGQASRYDLAARIVAARARATGGQPKLRAIGTAEYPTPARRPANSALDSSLFAGTFGFTARPWEEAVDDTVAEYLRRSGA